MAFWQQLKHSSGGGQESDPRSLTWVHQLAHASYCSCISLPRQPPTAPCCGCHTAKLSPARPSITVTMSSPATLQCCVKGHHSTCRASWAATCKRRVSRVLMIILSPLNRAEGVLQRQEGWPCPARLPCLAWLQQSNPLPSFACPTYLHGLRRTGPTAPPFSFSSLQLFLPSAFPPSSQPHAMSFLPGSLLVSLPARLSRSPTSPPPQFPTTLRPTCPPTHPPTLKTIFLPTH